MFLVWFKLVVIVGLAGGLHSGHPQMLSQSLPDAGISIALFGAASVFMAYQGFLTTDLRLQKYRQPTKTLPRAALWAIAVVIVGLIIVTIAAAFSTAYVALIFRLISTNTVHSFSLPCCCSVTKFETPS
jgi:hypothetical protein